jgi:peptidylprolyl isomerase
MQALPKGSWLVFGVLGACAALVVGVSWWLGNGAEQSNFGLLAQNENARPTTQLPGPLSPEELAAYEATIVNPMNPIAKITTNYGIVELELFADMMPITAGNFIKLAEEGFYNGTKFHRVIENFMIQGGDPNSKSDNVMTYGTGGPGYTIADEHIVGEYLTNVRGTIAMANSGPQSGGSQFFINLVDNTYLDFDKEPLSSKHPVFGRVSKGMEIVDEIGAVEVGPSDVPVVPVVVEQVEIVRGS